MPFTFKHFKGNKPGDKPPEAQQARVRSPRLEALFQGFQGTPGVTVVPQIGSNFVEGLLTTQNFANPFQRTDIAVTFARRFERLDAYTRRILMAMQSGAIGRKGIQFKFNDNRVQALWDNWKWNLLSPNMSIADMQKMMVHSLVRDGETFFQSLVVDDDIRLLWIDSLTIESHRGIDYDQYGRPVTYHTSQNNVATQGLWKPPVQDIAAEDMTHVFRRENANQLRGITWFVTSFPPLISLIKVEDAFEHMYITLANHPHYYTVADRMYNQMSMEGGANTPVDGDDDFVAAQQPDIQYIDGVGQNRPIYPEGIEIKSLDLPNGINTNQYNEYRRARVTKAARGVGLSYQAVFGDVREANFSSLRHAMLQDQETFMMVQSLVEHGMVDIHQKWADYQRERFPTLDYTISEIIYPQWDTIDPVKNSLAWQRDIRSGIVSRTEIIERTGRDPEEVFAELEYESDRLGLNEEEEESLGRDRAVDDIDKDG